MFTLTKQEDEEKIICEVCNKLKIPMTDLINKWDKASLRQAYELLREVDNGK